MDFGSNRSFLILIGYHLNLSPCENLGSLRLRYGVEEFVLLTLLAPTSRYVFYLYGKQNYAVEIMSCSAKTWRKVLKFYLIYFTVKYNFETLCLSTETIYRFAI